MHCGSTQHRLPTIALGQSPLDIKEERNQTGMSGNSRLRLAACPGEVARKTFQLSGWNVRLLPKQAACRERS
jgi:hypothetical protein